MIYSLTATSAAVSDTSSISYLAMKTKNNNSIYWASLTQADNILAARPMIPTNWAEKEVRRSSITLVYIWRCYY